MTETKAMVSLPMLLARNAERRANAIAYREKEYGIWQTWTWAEAQEEVDALAKGLAEELAYALDHCGARFVIAGDQEQVDKVADISEQLANLEHVVYLDGRGLRKYDHTQMSSYSDLQTRGREQGDSEELARRTAELTEDSTCVMLYTSGTTSRPKGVVLSNRNVIQTAKNSCEFDNLTHDEDILAYLPMAWVGDYIFSMGQALWAGFCVNCPESQDTMQSDLREIGPTYFFAPPQVFERQLTNVMIRMEDAGKLKKRMFNYFLNVAKRVGPTLLDGGDVSFKDKLSYTLGKYLVYQPLKDTLGLGRIRVGYTAGEAIGPELFDFYRSLGINLKQLYGQTEATVFITQQQDGAVRADTVGVPSPGVELKVDDSGEVFYRSPGVFVEYFKNPESTASTKTQDGWVATGDAGFIEENTGQLRIIDRVKDVGKMADGSLFAPKYVENKLKFYPDILESVVFGAQRDKCCAFINIDLTSVGNWAERNNVAYASYQELSQHPDVLKIIDGHIAEVNASIADDEMLAGCQVHRFLVLHKELDADDGEITRTRKVRRGVIAEKFKDLVDALYDGSSSIYTETEVTYEDGRKGKVSATLEIRDAKVISRSAQAA